MVQKKTEEKELHYLGRGGSTAWLREAKKNLCSIQKRGVGDYAEKPDKKISIQKA